MNALLIYMVKAAAYLAGFFLVYRFLLSRDTMYGRNRSFIILSIVSALILPAIVFETARPINFPVFSKVLSDIFINGTSTGNSSFLLLLTGISGYKWLFLIYLAGVIFCGIKLVFDFTELFVLISQQKTNGNKII